MSKKVMYLVASTVAGEQARECSTVREVSELLGKKVTKTDILAGQVPEVTAMEIDTEDPTYVARVLGSDGEYTEIPLNDPLHRDKPISEDEALDEIEHIIEDDSNDEEDTPEDINDPVDEPEDIEDNTDEDIPEDDNNTPDPEPVPTPNDKMAELMAKMKALHDKKNASQPAITGKKGKRSAKIEFTGEYPEKGTFVDENQLKKFYKQLSEEQLAEWLELEGLTYNPSDNEPINRMRKCMAILYYHFPKESKSSKKKSKYADLSTEELLEMALENNIDVPDAKGDARILRMYTIMALRKAGLME